MKLVTRGLLSAAMLLPAIAPAQPAGQAASAPAKASNNYALEPGTRLEYTTSGSLSGTPMAGGGESAQFGITFTVLASGAEGRTIYAAVTPQKDEKTTGGQQGEDIGGRFTFQVQPDGQLGEKMAGVSIPPFMGWSPMLYFPPIPEEDKTSMSLPMPAIGAEIPVLTTRSKQGEEIAVEFKLDESAFAGQQGQNPIADFSGKFLYSPAEKSVKTSALNLHVQQGGPGGQQMSIRLGFDANRTAISKLPKEQMDKLSKDVQAGIKAFDEVRQAMGGQEQNTTAAVAALDGYLKEFPQGEFAQIFQEQKKALTRMTDMAVKAAAIKEGAKAPDFTAKTLDGSSLKLSDLRGRVVLIDFWATWCGPCVREIPALKETYERFQDKGLSIVGVSGDRTEEALREFVKENELKWKQIWQDPDSEGTVLEQYGISKFPTTVLLDREGTIRAVDLRGADLEAAIQELVEGKAKQ